MPPSLTKRYDGIYIIRYKDSTGREHSKSTGYRERGKARVTLRDFRIPGHTSNATLREFSDAYLAHSKAEHQPTTQQLIRDILKPFLAWGGDWRLSTITPARMDEYRALLGTGRGKATVLIHLRQLKAMFTYAVQREYLAENPLRFLKNLYVKTSGKVYVSPDDFDKLWKGLRSKWHKDIIALAILTGLRRKELVELTWDDVQLYERLLHVRYGKGDRERWVPLNAQALLILNGMDQSTVRVFVTEKGTPPTLHHVSRLFARAKKRAGIDSDVHFHSLRHAFATLTLKNGAAVQDVQKIMGHTSIATTMGYSHLVSREMHETDDRLPSLRTIP